MNSLYSDFLSNPKEFVLEKKSQVVAWTEQNWQDYEGGDSSG